MGLDWAQYVAQSMGAIRGCNTRKAPKYLGHKAVARANGNYPKWDLQPVPTQAPKNYKPHTKLKISTSSTNWDKNHKDPVSRPQGITNQISQLLCTSTVHPRVGETPRSHHMHPKITNNIPK